MCQINLNPMKAQVGHLRVVVPPDIIDEESSDDVTIVEGANVTLKCRAKGYPQPNIEVLCCLQFYDLIKIFIFSGDERTAIEFRSAAVGGLCVSTYFLKKISNFLTFLYSEQNRRRTVRHYSHHASALRRLVVHCLQWFVDTLKKKLLQFSCQLFLLFSGVMPSVSRRILLNVQCKFSFLFYS